MDKRDKTLGDRIVYRGHLPLGWRPAESNPTPADLATMNESNGMLLKVLSAIDEMPQESLEGGSEVQQAYARLDAKLNLVLDLLGEALARQMRLPPARDFALSELGVVWAEAAGGPLPEQKPQNVYIELYLKPDFPRPLRFFATMSIKEKTAGSTHYMARFQGMSEEVRDTLAKLIFRQHRRMVANRRGAAS